MGQGGKIDSRAYKKEECVVEGKGFWAEGSKEDREGEGRGRRGREDAKASWLAYQSITQRKPWIARGTDKQEGKQRCLEGSEGKRGRTQKAKEFPLY